MSDGGQAPRWQWIVIGDELFGLVGHPLGLVLQIPLGNGGLRLKQHRYEVGLRAGDRDRLPLDRYFDARVPPIVPHQLGAKRVIGGVDLEGLARGDAIGDRQGRLKEGRLAAFPFTSVQLREGLCAIFMDPHAIQEELEVDGDFDGPPGVARQLDNLALGIVVWVGGALDAEEQGVPALYHVQLCPVIVVRLGCAEVRAIQPFARLIIEGVIVLPDALDRLEPARGVSHRAPDYGRRRGRGRGSGRRRE